MRNAKPGFALGMVYDAEGEEVVDTEDALWFLRDIQQLATGIPAARVIAIAAAHRQDLRAKAPGFRAEPSSLPRRWAWRIASRQG